MPSDLADGSALRKESHLFYVGVAVFLILLNIVAFVPAIVDPATRRVPLPMTGIVLLHTAAAIAWMLMFLVQSVLVATKRTAVHRHLGLSAALIAIAFVVTGWLMIVAQTRRGFDLSGDLVPGNTTVKPASILIVANAFLLFALLVGAAFWYRRQPAVHKRLMLLAMLGPVSGAPVAHLLGHLPATQPHAAALAPLINIVFMSIPMIHDRLSQGRIHRVSLWGGIGVVVWFAVWFGPVAQSFTWRDFTAWVLR